MTAFRPKILCRWCHSTKDNDEYENDTEVVYGEIRYPEEIHCKHSHGKHIRNPLHHNCSKADGSNNDSTFIKVDTIRSLLTCENTLVSHTPSHIEDDDDSSIIMTETSSHNLERSLAIKDNHLNEREPSRTPDVPLYYGFDTMTRNESQHSDRALDTEDSNVELVQASEREANRTPDVSPCQGIYMTMTRNTSDHSDRITDENYLKSTPTCEKEANRTAAGHDTYIIMTSNPSYHLKKNFINNDNVDCDKLMPTYVREADHTLDVPTHYSDDDDDDDDVTMTRNPSYNLGRNLVTDGNFEVVSHSSTVSLDNDSSIAMTQNPAYRSGRNITKNKGVNCVETASMQEREANHITIVLPPRNKNTKMTQGSLIQNRTYHSRRNVTQDKLESVSTCKREANHTLVVPPRQHESDSGIIMMPNPSYHARKNFFTKANSELSSTRKRETGNTPDASRCYNSHSTDDGMVQRVACYLKGNHFEGASSCSECQLVVACELEADSNPIIPQYRNDAHKSIKMSNINSHTVKLTENSSCHSPKKICN